ncbi:MAG: hypothetical protein JO057_02235, partial [Chloroflexi bacterium]|nr:hypothetical protein [Chloroflexota bacterium]
MPSHRMPRGLVALSASAVAAIYMAGYLRTQAADAAMAAAVPPSAVVAQSTPSVTAPQPVVQRQNPGSSRSGNPTAPNPSGTTAQASTVPASSSGAATAQATYKDGTYTGQGTSRRGDVWVSVQVQGGRIANVSITR